MTLTAASRVAHEIVQYSANLSESMESAIKKIEMSNKNVNVCVSKVKRRTYNPASTSSLTSTLHESDDEIFRLDLNIKSNNLKSSLSIQEINSNNTKKLFAMWMSQNVVQEGNHDYDVDPIIDKHHQFWRDLYCLLLRYKSLEGFGYQAGITNEAFLSLHEEFDCDVECFASPMNCFLKSSYCSAFLDTVIELDSN